MHKLITTCAESVIKIPKNFGNYLYIKLSEFSHIYINLFFSLIFQRDIYSNDIR